VPENKNEKLLKSEKTQKLDFASFKSISNSPTRNDRGPQFKLWAFDNNALFPIRELTKIPSGFGELALRVGKQFLVTFQTVQKFYTSFEKKDLRRLKGIQGAIWYLLLRYTIVHHCQVSPSALAGIGYSSDFADKKISLSG
jgi:hypothetical protein